MWSSKIFLNGLFRASFNKRVNLNNNSVLHMRRYKCSVPLLEARQFLIEWDNRDSSLPKEVIDRYLSFDRKVNFVVLRSDKWSCLSFKERQLLIERYARKAYLWRMPKEKYRMNVLSVAAMFFFFLCDKARQEKQKKTMFLFFWCLNRRENSAWNVI